MGIRVKTGSRHRAAVRYAFAFCLMGGSVYGQNRPNGVLWDRGANLEWTQNDNGEDIDWQHARAYCAGAGDGWRLPRLPELQSIYDGHASGVRCAKDLCRVTLPFHLTGSWFWSATQVGKDATDGVELAWGMQMVNGAPTQAVRDASYGSRVLCVRDRPVSGRDQ